MTTGHIIFVVVTAVLGLGSLAHALRRNYIATDELKGAGAGIVIWIGGLIGLLAVSFVIGWVLRGGGG